MQPNRVIWVLTSTCPSRCVYCDIESQTRLSDLESDEIARVASEIRSAGFRDVIFVGGEPLLSPALPRALEALGPDIDKAVFTGGIPGDAARWVRALAGANRLVVSLDAANEDENDRVRGRPGITRALLNFLDVVQRELPELYLSSNTVVSKHNVERVAEVWDLLKPRKLTGFALTLAGENFEHSPLLHLASKTWLEKLYFELVPPLARRVRADGTDFVMLPIPLPLLEARIPPERWDERAVTSSDVVRAELERFSRGDHNRAFVERYGCPLVGRDITVGVAGDVHPCSQAPIIKREYVLGNVKERSLQSLLDGPELAEFAERMPHAPCHRCWAPSNVPREVLDVVVPRRGA
jgi:radical SAM protein with 4Fe4S-binding SPASM domain